MSSVHVSPLLLQNEESDDSDLEKLALGMVLILRRRRKRRERKKIKRLWIRPLLTRRQSYGAYENLMKELENKDIQGYISFQRMHPDIFQELLHKVSPLITRKDTTMRLAIPPGLRLALTLRYMATGQTYMTQQFQFRVAANTIGKIVPDTCEAIYRVLQDDYFKCPQTTEEWMTVAESFQTKWQFPNCIGAVDGKHVLIRPPAKSGSVFFNYKHSLSVVLMGVVDANYKFLYVDNGTNGRVSDGGVFAATNLYSALEGGKINVPPPKCLPGDNTPMPFTLVADDAFALRSYIMKPFPFRQMSKDQRIFNYRLSRARRVVENAFGILANRFRVLLQPMLIKPANVEKVVLAACALHNMLRDRAPGSFNHVLDQEDEDTHHVIPGHWREESTMQAIHIMRGNNSTNSAKAQRNYLSEYFLGPAGAVPWQDRMV